jgi:response regulator RpfG family c-di-GMP phosphodiesterase
MKRLRQREGEGQGEAREGGRKLTLIAVDDEPSNLNILERIFAPEYDVLKALNGAEALAMLRARAEDEVVAVLSDQRMPGMTGVELLAKAAEERPHIARVLITGYSDMDAIIAAINVAHVMYYVSKPYEPATIRQVVRRALDERARQRDLAERLDELRQRTAALELQIAAFKKER